MGGGFPTRSRAILAAVANRPLTVRAHPLRFQIAGRRITTSYTADGDARERRGQLVDGRRPRFRANPSIPNQAVLLWLPIVGRPRLTEAAPSQWPTERISLGCPRSRVSRAGLASSSLAAPAATPTDEPSQLPALLAIPEPAQPARPGVAIKQPPQSGSSTLESLSIPGPEGS